MITDQNVLKRVFGAEAAAMPMCRMGPKSRFLLCSGESFQLWIADSSEL